MYIVLKVNKYFVIRLHAIDTDFFLESCLKKINLFKDKISVNCDTVLKQISFHRKFFSLFNGVKIEDMWWPEVENIKHFHRKYEVIHAEICKRYSRVSFYVTMQVQECFSMPYWQNIEGYFFFSFFIHIFIYLF